MKSEPVTDRNGTPASPATARAMSVLPVPGGPTSRTPLGMRAPISANSLGVLQEVDDLGDLLLDALVAGDVGERRARALGRVRLRLRPPDGHDAAHLRRRPALHPDEEQRRSGRRAAAAAAASPRCSRSGVVKSTPFSVNRARSSSDGCTGPVVVNCSPFVNSPVIWPLVLSNSDGLDLVVAQLRDEFAVPDLGAFGATEQGREGRVRRRAHPATPRSSIEAIPDRS